MEIVQIISEHKNRLKSKPVKPGFKRVMAIVREGKLLQTRHLDVPNK